MLRVTVALMVVTVPLAAQHDSRLVRGRVTDSTGRAIPFANVQINGASRIVATDSGAFSYDVRGKGEFSLRVFRIGYEPRLLKLSSVGDTAVNVVLAAIPKLLGATEVEAGRISRRLETRGFYDRLNDRAKGIGTGHFFTQDDIAARNPLVVSEMVRETPGVRLMPKREAEAKECERLRAMRRIAPQCEARNTKPSVHGEWILVGNSFDPNTNRRCDYSLFVDGTRISPDFKGFPLAIDEVVSVNGVAALEVYARTTGIPAPYQLAPGTCGAAFFWSK